jgi:hypothetical protein
MAALGAHLATYLVPAFGRELDTAAAKSRKAALQRGWRMYRGGSTN